MAKRCYNTFVVVDCQRRKPVLVTSSARKAREQLRTGVRVEVWNANSLVERIYGKERDMLAPYIQAEREYIGNKQRAAEQRNGRGRKML